MFYGTQFEIPTTGTQGEFTDKTQTSANKIFIVSRTIM